MEQVVRFCTATDGVRIAYATVGEGPPLVKAANWLNHLEFDWQSPIWRHLLEELARDHLLVRYDERGNGLSDWQADDLTFDAFVRDLEAVVDAAAIGRFALFGISQGGAVAISYAVRHPERVSQLILLGAYARGWAARDDREEIERRRALLTLTRHGWGQEVPAYRQLFTNIYVPDANPDQARWFSDLQRISTSPANAARLITVFSEIDVRELLPQVAVPTLVLHARNELVVPFEEGRQLAAAIPGARFVALEGRNHLLLESEPAWSVFLKEVRAFLATGSKTEQSVSAQLDSGARLGRYEVEAFIGSGGMGAVYRAHDTQLQRRVAIKVLTQVNSDDLDRLLREARAAAALNHPNVCTVYEVASDRSRHFIVMEFVDGRLLSDVCLDGLDTTSALAFGIQITDALAYAHREAMIHRDLKPANVAVTSAGRIKLLDFGLATRVAPKELSEVTRAATVAAQVVGTVPYLAPELLVGKPPGAPADVWAFGITLYELLTGTRPFAGQTTFDLTAAILHTDPAPLPATIPSALQRLIKTCLAKNPVDRPTSMSVHHTLSSVHSVALRRRK